MKHEITLSNGRKLIVEEGDNCLHIADEEDGFPGAYICEISPSGVLVMPNSGGATADLTEGLLKN